MKTILFVDPTDTRTLSLEEICRGLEVEITTVDSDSNAIAAMDSRLFDILITTADIETVKFIISQSNPVKCIVVHDVDIGKIAAFKKKFFWSNINTIRLVCLPFDSGQDSMFGQVIRSLL